MMENTLFLCVLGLALVSVIHADPELCVGKVNTATLDVPAFDTAVAALPTLFIPWIQKCQAVREGFAFYRFYPPLTGYDKCYMWRPSLAGCQGHCWRSSAGYDHSLGYPRYHQRCHHCRGTISYIIRAFHVCFRSNGSPLIDSHNPAVWYPALGGCYCRPCGRQIGIFAVRNYRAKSSCDRDADADGDDDMEYKVIDESEAYKPDLENFNSAEHTALKNQCVSDGGSDSECTAAPQ